jgi:hypothetical protein
MGGGLRLQTRRASLQQMIPQYREASSVKKKSKLLDAFTVTTGYNRQRPCQYGPDVQHALFLAWNAANRICAKRLIPFLPTLLEAASAA